MTSLGFAVHVGDIDRRLKEYEAEVELKLDRYRRLRPLISAGCGRSMSLQIVGATSQSLPPPANFPSAALETRTSGTSLIVWAVNSPPVARSIFSSALP